MKFKKIITIVGLIFLGIILAYLIFYRQPTYKDNSVGFEINIPKKLTDIGYEFKKDTNNPYKRIEYKLNLFYTNPKDNSKAQVQIGYFYAVPIQGYQKIVCTPQDVLCSEPEEIGRNSKFVFLSAGIPPEPFSECSKTNFFNLNKNFCENGPSYRFIERDASLFNIVEPN